MKIKNKITIGFAMLLFACATPPTANQQALLVGANQLANIAGTAAATYYGGPAAGILASAGLNALGTVVQGYVGSTIPTSVVAAAPGVSGVGQAVTPVIAPNVTLTQADVNTIFQAASLVAKKK